MAEEPQTQHGLGPCSAPMGSGLRSRSAFQRLVQGLLTQFRFEWRGALLNDPFGHHELDFLSPLRRSASLNSIRMHYRFDSHSSFLGPFSSHLGLGTPNPLRHSTSLNMVREIGAQHGLESRSLSVGAFPTHLGFGDFTPPRHSTSLSTIQDPRAQRHLDSSSFSSSSSGSSCSHYGLSEFGPMRRSTSLSRVQELRAEHRLDPRSFSTSSSTSHHGLIDSIPMRRSSSLSRVQELQMQHRLESRSVSISSVDELQSVLSDNNEPLFIDIPKRENIEIIFPPNSTHITPTHVASKVSFGKANGKLHSYEALRNSSPRRTRSATPVVYRSNSAASLYREQQKVPLFVPSQILMSPHHHHHSSYSEDPFDGFDGPAFELEPEHPKPAHYVPPTDETTAGRYGSDFSPTDDLPNDLPDDLTDELPGDTKAKGKESKPKKSKARKVKAACRKGWDKIRRLVRKMF